MPNKCDIWMPLYIRDYVVDTLHLTDAQHGHYMMAIMAYWVRGGPLPDGDDYLATICKMAGYAADVRSHHLQVLRAFFRHEDGLLYHDRIERELGNARAKSVQAREAANSRHHRKSKKDADASPPHMRQQMRNDATAPTPVTAPTTTPLLPPCVKSNNDADACIAAPAAVDAGRMREGCSSPSPTQDISKDMSNTRGGVFELLPPAKGKAKFSPPGLEAIIAHALTVGVTEIVAREFWAYYESNGWRVGKNPMKNWHAALAGWHNRNERQNYEIPATPGNGKRFYQPAGQYPEPRPRWARPRNDDGAPVNGGAAG